VAAHVVQQSAPEDVRLAGRMKPITWRYLPCKLCGGSGVVLEHSGACRGDCHYCPVEDGCFECQATGFPIRDPATMTEPNHDEPF